MPRGGVGEEVPPHCPLVDLLSGRRPDACRVLSCWPRLRMVRVMRSSALALPPLLRIDQAASITQGLTVRPLAPLRGVGAAALPTGHGAARVAVAAAGPVRVSAVVVVVMS